MPVELSDLLGNERWVEVQVTGGSFQVAYRPGSTSLRRQAELQKRMRELQKQENADEIEQANEVGAVFCEMVSNWDLTEAGRPLPITPEVVTGKLPGVIFNAIMEAIGEDGQSQQDEKKALSVTSGAGLPPGARPAIARNGTHSLERHDTWAR